MEAMSLVFWCLFGGVAVAGLGWVIFAPPKVSKGRSMESRFQEALDALQKDGFEVLFCQVVCPHVNEAGEKGTQFLMDIHGGFFRPMPLGRGAWGDDSEESAALEDEVVLLPSQITALHLGLFLMFADYASWGKEERLAFLRDLQEAARFLSPDLPPSTIESSISPVPLWVWEHHLGDPPLSLPPRRSP